MAQLFQSASVQGLQLLIGGSVDLAENVIRYAGEELGDEFFRVELGYIPCREQFSLGVANILARILAHVVSVTFQHHDMCQLTTKVKRKLILALYLLRERG